jgi:hypothetical protein
MPTPCPHTPRHAADVCSCSLVGHTEPNDGDETACKCNAGYTGPYGSIDGTLEWDNRACAACPSGKYKAETGTAPCVECPANTDTRNLTGRGSLADCKCKVGWAGPDGGPCTECPAGAYATHGGSPPGSVPAPDTFSCFDYGQTGCCRLEVYHDGQWGAICDDKIARNHPNKDAVLAVACRTLGCSDVGAGYQKKANAGMAHNRIFLDDLECSGTEALLSDCNFRGWGLHNCQLTEVIAFCCNDCPDSTVNWLGNETGVMTLPTSSCNVSSGPDDPAAGQSCPAG